MMTVATNLQLYLERIGIADLPPVNGEGLARVQRSHMRAITFENFDVLLGRPVATDMEGIFEQLVQKRRGGYCFQTNTLLFHMLSAMGFSARQVLARVFFASPGGVPARLHATTLVELDGVQWLVDGGFGGHTPRSPIALVDGAEVRGLGRTWRLQQDDEHGWMLMDLHDGGWRRLYAFDSAPVHPSDIEVANHYTATCAQSPFVHFAMIARQTIDGRVTLFGSKLARHTGSGPESRLLRDLDDFRAVVEQDFNLDLGLAEDEWQALWQRVNPPAVQVDW